MGTKKEWDAANKALEEIWQDDSGQVELARVQTLDVIGVEGDVNGLVVTLRDDSASPKVEYVIRVSRDQLKRVVAMLGGE